MKPSDSLVSVIIPCYNQSRYLPEALECLTHQTYKHLEVIVIDDGSTEDVRSVVEQTQGFALYVRQENRGPSAARNAGLAKCHGDYIQYLDADDLLEPDKINSHVNFLKAHPSIGVVYGDVRYFPDGKPEMRLPGLTGDNLPWQEDQPWVARRWNEPGTMAEKLIGGNMLAINCALVRKTANDVVGGWDEDLRAVEDWYYWLKMALLGVSFQFVEQAGTLALVRSHTASASRNITMNEAASFQMAIKAGMLIQEPRLKLANYLGVVHQVQRLDTQEWKRFLALVRANACGAVYSDALKVAITRNPISLRIRNIARRLSRIVRQRLD